MVNCKKASELVSKKIDQELSWFEKFSLKFHIFICGACSMFETETEVLSDCMKKKNTDIPTLSEEKKRSLQDAINTHK